MICPFCAEPLQVTHHERGGAIITELRCAMCSESPPAPPPDIDPAAMRVGAAYGVATLLNLIHWTAERVPADRKGSEYLKMIHGTVSSLAIVGAGSHTYDERRRLIAGVLTGLLVRLRSILDDGGAP